MLNTNDMTLTEAVSEAAHRLTGATQDFDPLMTLVGDARFVLLNEAILATLLIDLLTSDEEAIDLRTAHLRFDIDLLAERLVAATDWLTLFEEPGALDEVARLARAWFEQHLTRPVAK